MKRLPLCLSLLLLPACNNAQSQPATQGAIPVFGNQPKPTLHLPQRHDAAPAEPFQVRLKRGACFGRCPVYELTLHADGRIEYLGRLNVAMTGERHGAVDPEAVNDLRQRLEQTDAGLFTRYVHGQAACGNWSTDMPTVVVDAYFGGLWHHLEHDWGCAAAPAALKSLEAQIDSAAQAESWIGSRASE